MLYLPKITLMNKKSISRRSAFLVKVTFIPTNQQVGFQKLTASALKYLISRFRIYYDDRTKRYDYPRSHFDRLISECPFEFTITSNCIISSAQANLHLRSISSDMSNVLSNYLYDYLF